MREFKRKISLLLVVGFVFAGLVPVAHADEVTRPTVTVYKSPYCGCCAKWVEHMRRSGFPVIVEDVSDISAVKLIAGIPGDLEACHTASVAGYVVEGHVPANDVDRLLAQRPTGTGLAVPGMPAGSPGMEQGGRSDAFDVVLFSGAARTVFAHY